MNGPDEVLGGFMRGRDKAGIAWKRRSERRERFPDGLLIMNDLPGVLFPKSGNDFSPTFVLGGLFRNHDGVVRAQSNLDRQQEPQKTFHEALGGSED